MVSMTTWNVAPWVIFLRQVINDTCSEWARKVRTALEAQLKKVPQGKGPLAEIDFWRERNAALSALTHVSFTFSLTFRFDRIFSQLCFCPTY
jgi:dynein heavy chain